jgi:hypothetical protein
MRKFLSIVLWIACVVLVLLGIANAQSKTVVLMFSEGQQPQIAKMPKYAYCGMQPLTKDDKVLDAVEFEAKGKNIYNKAIKYYFKAMDHFLKSNRFIMPDKMRMLVIVKNVNKAFSTSGNVSANFTDSTNNNTNLVSSGNTLTKNSANSLSSSGGIFPSFSKSWTDQKFEIWFFLVE